MNLSTELSELAISLLPSLLCLTAVVRPPRVIGAWVGYVLLTATLSVVSIGLLLMRLVAECVPLVEPCAEGMTSHITLPGVLTPYPQCIACVPAEIPASTRWSLTLNTIQIDVAVVAAVFSTLMSLFMLVRFARWVRSLPPRR